MSAHDAERHSVQTSPNPGQTIPPLEEELLPVMPPELLPVMLPELLPVIPPELLPVIPPELLPVMPPELDVNVPLEPVPTPVPFDPDEPNPPAPVVYSLSRISTRAPQPRMITSAASPNPRETRVFIRRFFLDFARDTRRKCIYPRVPQLHAGVSCGTGRSGFELSRSMGNRFP